MSHVHICVIAKDPSRPLAVASAEIGKEMFRSSKLGPDLEFRKELGLGFWSVWKDTKEVGWINMSKIVDHA